MSHVAELHAIWHAMENDGSTDTSTNESRPHINESRPTYEWVTSHVWMSHVPQNCMLFGTPWKMMVAPILVSIPVHALLMIFDELRMFSFLTLTFLCTFFFLNFSMISFFRHTLQFLRVIWLIHAYNNSYVWYDSFTHAIIHTCDMTHSHVQQFIRVTRKGSCVWHDSFLSVTWKKSQQLKGFFAENDL